MSMFSSNGLELERDQLKAAIIASKQDEQGQCHIKGHAQTP
jgi:hypothetical protein